MRAGNGFGGSPRLCGSRVAGARQVGGGAGGVWGGFSDQPAVGGTGSEQCGLATDLAMAQSRVGGVLQAQGKLAEAQAAFEEDLAISRRLAEQDPSNTGWQGSWRWRTAGWAGCCRRKASWRRRRRRLGRIWRSAGGWPSRTRATRAGNRRWRWRSRVGGVLQAQGKLTEAQAGLRRTWRSPAAGGAGSQQCGLAGGFGGGAQPGRRRVAGARQTGGGAGGLRGDLEISRRLADKTPATRAGSGIWRWRTAGWAACWRRKASWRRHRPNLRRIWRSAGGWPSRTPATRAGNRLWGWRIAGWAGCCRHRASCGGEAAFGEDLAIRRRLAELDPSNAGWQRIWQWRTAGWATCSQAQGKLAEAQAAFEEDLAILRRLAAQDPSNADLATGLAVAHSRVGGVLEAQGKLAEAQAAFEENLTILRRLVEQTRATPAGGGNWQWRTAGWAGCWRRRAS